MDQDLSSSEARVGEYAIPPHLDRFNPGAFLLPELWSLVYGIWPWFLILLGLVFLQLPVAVVLRNTIGGKPWDSVWWQIGFLVMTRPFAAVFAFRANRLRWEREHRRIHAQAVPRPPDLVSKFERAQRNWLIAGLVLLGYNLLVSPFVLGDHTWRAFMSPAIAVFFDLSALALLVLWDRRSTRPSGQS